MIGKEQYIREIWEYFCQERLGVASRGQGGVTMSHLYPHCNSFQMEDYVWWVSGRETYELVVCDLRREV